MTFSKAKSVGWINDRDTITAAELEHMDGILPDAIDGASGGTWAPSAPIIINGQGMQISPLKSSVLTGALLLSGNDCHVRWRLDNSTMTDGWLNPGPGVLTTAYDEYHSSGVMTGNHTVYIATSAGLPLPLSGDRIRIRWKITTNHQLVIRDDVTSALIATLQPGASFNASWIELIFDGAGWLTSGFGVSGTSTVTVTK